MKKQKKYVLGILMCMILCFLAPGINGQAATPENVMQSSKAVSGKLETTSKGVRYYNSRTGKYEKKKWLKVKNNIYYFTSKGYAKTGWKTHNGRKYYFDQKGRLVTSWQKIGKYTYYMWKNKGNLSGSAATGKVQIAKRYYYFSKKGVMETGWKKIAGYYYYFSPQTGQMAVNTTVGKYKVDSRGRRVSSTSGKKNTGKVYSESHFYLLIILMWNIIFRFPRSLGNPLHTPFNIAPSAITPAEPPFPIPRNLPFQSFSFFLRYLYCILTRSTGDHTCFLLYTHFV